MSERSTASTRVGDIRWYYAREIEERPFSRFTANPAEIKANAEWAARALAWGNKHFDERGHRI